MNEIVKYDNYMNGLKFSGFTTTDFNFLMALCSRMRDSGANEITFNFSELRSITEYKKSNSIKQFVADIKKMNDKLMRITCSLETETEIIMFVLFPTFIINFNNQTLTVAVNEKFRFILNELVKNFTRFDLKEFVKLDSKYSKTLYRLLKQFKTAGIFEVKLNDFRKKVDCPASYSTKYIMDKIIKPSIKELQNYFQDLQCTVKYEHKRGRPVEGYIFTFKPEQLPKPAPKELSERIDSLSELQVELTNEEMDRLISEFGKELVMDYIERTSAYNCCTYAKIRQWITEDLNKNIKSKKQFNQFMEREISKEKLDELERILIKH